MNHAYAARLNAQALRPQSRQHISSRMLWGLLVTYTLLTMADVVSTLMAFSTAAGRHVPMWRFEWNPLMAVVMRTGGTNGWLLFEGACVVLPWVLSPLAWRIQFDWSMRDTTTQAVVRRLVLVPLVALCVWRAGAASFNLGQIVLAPLGSPGSPAPVLPVASPTSHPTATTAPTVTAAPVATSTPTPKPTVTPKPTATPRPQPTATPTHCPHDNCGG